WSSDVCSSDLSKTADPVVHFQIVDTPETAVVKDQDIYLLSFLHNGHDLTVKHLKAGISHYTVNFLVRFCKFYPQSGGHFVSHAGIAIFCMIASSFICSPHSLHAAGQRASGC